MMNILFFTFNELQASNGVSKKILYQKKALEENGHRVYLMHVKSDGKSISLYIDDKEIGIFHHKYLWLFSLYFLGQYILPYVKEYGIHYVYVRYTFFASPFTVLLFKRLRSLGLKIALEIPSYPYDNEFKTFKLRIFSLWEKCWRLQLAKYVDSIVTFSKFDSIWRRPTLKIKNGIDFSKVPIRQKNRVIKEQLVIIAVANIAFWHGFDRIIEGLNLYYRENKFRDVKVYLKIVGKGNKQTYDFLVNLVKKYNLRDYVSFYGEQYGKSLDELFETADLAIGCLGCHRKKIKEISSLKNVEYAARGIPFIYSEQNPDFDNMPYVKKELPDDSPINIQELVEWRKKVNIQPSEIRSTVEPALSWKQQMKKVTDYFLKCD